jgi:Skp family chaperone for outer membrane proteins
MFKKTVALILCLFLTCPVGFARSSNPPRIETASQMVQKSYLDLLEMQTIPKFSPDEIKAVQDQLEKERKTEQDRLKKEEQRIEKELKVLRDQLKDLNKKASRDDSADGKERDVLHCRILQLEAALSKARLEREHGMPIGFQNKLAKLELIQQWPAIRAGIEQKIEAERARERRYGDVEDIGVRDLGIEDLARKQNEDIKTGQDAIREMKSQGLMPPEVEDKELVNYVQELSKTIARNSDLRTPLKLTVLDSMEINAFALPGGFLFVNSGLINKAETESELVGVLAHEIAHDAARHGARLMKRATIANIFYQVAQVAAVLLAGPVGIGAYYALQYGFYGLGMILDLTLLGVSRDFEAEADQLGAQYAWQSGYDPRGFITFFDKMASEKGYVRSASFFRTHPPFLERIISTFSEITYLPPTGDLRVDSSGFAEVKKRAAELIKKREEEDKNRPTLRGKEPKCEEILKERPISD